MNVYWFAFYFLATLNFAKCNLKAYAGLEPYITGGDFVKYNQYPHSAYLVIELDFDIVCGGSILNQEIILTAAHCLEDFTPRNNRKVKVKYGHEDISKMQSVNMKKFIIHREYDDEYLNNDICLLSTRKRMNLNAAKRIILMKNPPTAKYGHVSGWGNDENSRLQKLLKHTNAVIHSIKVCKSNGWLPEGAFCAGPITGLGAADQGDSGGALVINDCIQIGIVSYRLPEKSLVGYTNVSYFLDWIRRNSKRLYCGN